MLRRFARSLRKVLWLPGIVLALTMTYATFSSFIGGFNGSRMGVKYHDYGWWHPSVLSMDGWSGVAQQYLFSLIIPVLMLLALGGAVVAHDKPWRKP